MNRITAYTVATAMIQPTCSSDHWPTLSEPVVTRARISTGTHSEEVSWCLQCWQHVCSFPPGLRAKCLVPTEERITAPMPAIRASSNSRRSWKTPPRTADLVSCSCPSCYYRSQKWHLLATWSRAAISFFYSIVNYIFLSDESSESDQRLDCHPESGKSCWWTVSLKRF